jgi:hypothetical protein
VSSAYNVAGVENDAHGNPAKIFVRKTSWDHAVQMVVGADGVTRAVIDWEWFESYRDTLLAKVAAGKRVIPEIYQRYLKPTEQLLTLAQNTYGRKAGGRVWQNHLHRLLTEPPLRAIRTNTEAAWWHIPKAATKFFPESSKDGMPDGGGDIQVHTDDMLIRPKRMYEYATKVLQEQKGLKLTCSGSVEAHVGVKIVYGTNEEGHTTVALLQDQSIKKMHTAFKELLDEREQVRNTRRPSCRCVPRSNPPVSTRLISSTRWLWQR